MSPLLFLSSCGHQSVLLLWKMCLLIGLNMFLGFSDSLLKPVSPNLHHARCNLQYCIIF